MVHSSRFLLNLSLLILLGPSSVLGALSPDYTGTPCPGDVISLTCTAPASTLIWIVPDEIVMSVAIDANEMLPLVRGPYTVTSFVLTTMPVMSTSTLSFPAEAATFGCTSEGGFMEEYTVQVVDSPSEPLSVTHIVTTASSDRVNVTVSWVSPMDNGGSDVTNYTVTIPQLFAAVITSTSVTVTDANYNMNYTVSVVATNCAGNSSTAATLDFRINGCPPLTNPMNGAFGPIANRLQGTVVTFSCDPGYESSVTMVTCEGADTPMWSPDPMIIQCASLTPTTPPPMNCTEQLSPPQNGSVSNYTVPAIPGTEVTFQCDEGLFPDMIMNATCQPTGQWDRDPGTIVCRTAPVSCVLPDPPPNGLLLDPNINNTEGSVISLQCEPGYMGGGTATCTNSGSWDPGLAMLCAAIGPSEQEPGIAAVAGGVVGGILVVIIVIAIIVVVCVLVAKHKDRYNAVDEGIEMADQGGLYSQTTHAGPRNDSRQNRASPPEEDGYHRASRPVDPALQAYDDVTLNPEERVNDDGYSALNGNQGPQRLPGYGQLNNVNPVEPVIYADLGTRGAKPISNRGQQQVDQHRVDYASVDHIATAHRAATMPASPDRPPPPNPAADADKLLNLDQALVQLRPVQPRWQELATALRVPETYVQQIEDMCRNDHANAMTEVVDYWMRSCSGRPTWRELADGLKRIREDHLAQQLMSIYDTGRLPVELDMNEVPPEVYKYDRKPPPPVPARSPTVDSPGLSRTLPARAPPKFTESPAPIVPPRTASTDELIVPPRPPKPKPKH